jgi:HSP20 family protein
MAALIPWRERSEIDRFRTEIDRLFDDFFIRRSFGRDFEEGDWMPAVDISESEKEIIIHAEIPGVDAKDLDITLSGRNFTIKGERKQEQEEKRESYHRIERRYGSFHRSFELPADVDGDKVEAAYEDGVLTVNLPKSKEQSVKKTEVKVAKS